MGPLAVAFSLCLSIPSAESVPACLAAIGATGKITVSSGAHQVAGSGTLIGPNLVLTAAHVIWSTKGIKVQWAMGGTEDMVLISSDIYRDVAFLRVPRSSDSVRLVDSPPLPPFFTVGYPDEKLAVAGQFDQVTSVLVISPALLFSDMMVLPCGGMHEGASGGGVFDSRGRLFGLLSFRDHGASNCFCVPIRAIRGVAESTGVTLP